MIDRDAKLRKFRRLSTDAVKSDVSTDNGAAMDEAANDAIHAADAHGHNDEVVLKP